MKYFNTLKLFWALVNPRVMDELGLAILLSLWIATLLVLAIWVAFWKTRKKKRERTESDEFLSDEFSQIDDEPVLDTKLSSIQPIYKPYPITFEVGWEGVGTEFYPFDYSNAI